MGPYMPTCYKDSVGVGSHSWIAIGAEPDAHHFSHDLFIEGDQVEENSEQYRSNSETRLGMHR
jgi:hypothetical protein